MADERRYREEEVAQIVDLAVRSAEGERPAALGEGGLTLGAIINLLPTLAVAGAGVGFLAWARFKLPRWARERESQMEDIATRVRALVGDAGPEDSET